MKGVLKNILLPALLLASPQLFAQQKGRLPDSVKKKAFYPPVYLGNSEYKGGPIKKDVFDRLLRDGITSHDSLGNTYKILSFDFNYAERMLYEDNSGYPAMMTDLYTYHCAGDKLSPDLMVAKAASESVTGEARPGIFERTKAGDTAYFDHIMVVKIVNSQPETDDHAVLARTMKFPIVK